MYKFTGFTEKANAALNASISSAENMGHTYVGSEHLLLGLLLDNGGVSFTALAARKLTAEKVEEVIKDSVGIGSPTVLSPNEFTPRFKHIIETAIAQARAMGHSYVGTEHLLISLIKEGQSAAVNIMNRLGASPQEILDDVIKGLGNPAAQVRGAGKSKEKSNTPTLNQYGRDITDMARQNMIDPVIGRQKEIERVIQILSRRTKNNPCLIGEPGVGKTAIAEGLALKSRRAKFRNFSRTNESSLST